jgi:hypothetical protein
MIYHHSICVYFKKNCGCCLLVYICNSCLTISIINFLSSDSKTTSYTEENISNKLLTYISTDWIIRIKNRNLFFTIITKQIFHLPNNQIFFFFFSFTIVARHVSWVRKLHTFFFPIKNLLLLSQKNWRHFPFLFYHKFSSKFSFFYILRPRRISIFYIAWIY